MSAEAKLIALMQREPGWQRAFTKDARRVLSGAVADACSGRAVMPNERTRAERGRPVLGSHAERVPVGIAADLRGGA